MTPDGLDIERLDAARRTVARIILARGKDGEVFLPIFERLDREIAEIERRRDALTRVARFAAKKLPLAIAADLPCEQRAAD
jgi:hypothetical protein